MAFESLLVDGLEVSDSFDSQLTKMLPKMAKAASYAVIPVVKNTTS
ncbi:hypothetical protein BH11PLA2_BH11PLA2_14580 [soil metagenome]